MQSGDRDRECQEGDFSDCVPEPRGRRGRRTWAIVDSQLRGEVGRGPLLFRSELFVSLS